MSLINHRLLVHFKPHLIFQIHNAMVSRGRGGARGGARGGLRATGRGRGGATAVGGRQQGGVGVAKRGFMRVNRSIRGAGNRGAVNIRAPGKGSIVDARQRLINRHRSQITDARDKLAQLAKTSDAREKIKRIQNIKQGKLEVKSTSNGAITITKTTRGTVELTTRRKLAKQKQQTTSIARSVAKNTSPGKPSGVVKRKHIGGERLQLSTVNQGTFIKPVKNNAVKKAKNRSEQQPVQLTRTITGNMSDAAILDQELLNTHADPLVLKRTVEQSAETRRSRSNYSPGRGQLRFPRGDSGEDVDLNGANRVTGRRRYDYDDPREVTEREDEVYRRRIQRESANTGYSGRTMADRFESDAHRANSSILQGSKIVVSNLQSSVTEEDIKELFGDVGPLRRARMVDSGTAEVVFINVSDAYKAIEIYHNRQLDHKPMQCHFAGSAPDQRPESDSRLRSQIGSRARDRGASDSRVPAVEMGTVHKALFGQVRGGQPEGNSSMRNGRARVALRP